jgi:histidinol phosphatase-like enzyme (inositol monophosphatase family)
LRATRSDYQCGDPGTLQDFALALADASSKAILPHFRQAMDIENKDLEAFDPVTIADRAGEACMRRMIEERFPDHGIIGEEYGCKLSRSGYTWVLDPIDGTKSFIIGFPAWATLIGLMYEDRPLIGLMSQPYVGETFVGSRDGGAFHIRSNRKTVLRVTDGSTLASATAGTIGPERFKTLSQVNGFSSLSARVRMMRYGGDAYFYCLLASGLLDIAFDADLQPYDVIPLIPIVEGAGGIIRTWQMGNASSGGNIVSASNETLLVEAVAALGSGSGEILS